MPFLPIIILTIALTYCALVIIFYIGFRRSSLTYSPCDCNSYLPLSVVVAMRNEGGNIENLLQSINDQDYPKELLEVLVIDDHSSDSSWQATYQWNERMPSLRLHKLPEGDYGKKSAVSFGIQQAQNNLIVITDADCTMPPTWLSTIAQIAAKSNAAMLIGAVVMKADSTFVGRMGALEHASLTAATLGAAGVGMPIMASSGNLAFRKDLVSFKASMLNPSVPSGDDMFLLHSIKHKRLGAIVPINTPMGVTYTNGPLSLKEILNQRSRWASKAPAYRDWHTIVVGLVVVLFNLSILVAIAMAIMYPYVWPLLACVLISRGICDYLLLKDYLSIFKQTYFLKVFLPLQVVYPFYIIYTLIRSLVWPTKWKERKPQ